MEIETYKGETVADPGKFIRLTLRGHYVRWRLDRALASGSSSYGGETPGTGERPAACG